MEPAERADGGFAYLVGGVALMPMTVNGGKPRSTLRHGTIPGMGSARKPRPSKRWKISWTRRSWNPSSF